MSTNDQTPLSTTQPDHGPDMPPPPWATALLAHISALELQASTTPTPLPPLAQEPMMPMDAALEDDPFITERAPDTDFHPYPEFQQALRGLGTDFFRHPLPETTRRRFIGQCPRNTEREYTPPAPTTNVPLNGTARRMDHQLVDIQYRLPGITRPLGFYLHQVLWGKVSRLDSIEFVNIIHELLVDTASFITQLRMDNFSQPLP
ncbi:hypothetical protein BX666DRAFT_1879680 [Dichotomocladium elegans]|nr:hypothetical protein BX666DRAFT_1879680 [Dichotomocladium elegans]